VADRGKECAGWQKTKRRMYDIIRERFAAPAGLSYAEDIGINSSLGFAFCTFALFYRSFEYIR
jgi:hypothetical protein